VIGTTRLRDAVIRSFSGDVGRAPDGVWGAPGRVNLIGEHTDYNDGFVMPFALTQRVVLAAAPRPDRRWTVTSLNNGQRAEFGPEDLHPGMPGWSAYVAGIVWALGEAGHDVDGADLHLVSDVPSGAGLSSSAALECATLTALVELNELEIGDLDRVKLAQRCENIFVGAPTGIMDQAASVMCTAGHSLFLDCRTLETAQVPLSADDSGLAFLVIDTRTPHALVDSEYAERRAACEAVARQLGVPALRDVESLDQVTSRISDTVLARRARHVVTENDRVQQAVRVLKDGRLRDLAPILDASHASMRDDFEITVPTVDLAVEEAVRAGALGARMTGGGFGGCIIALVPSAETDAVAGSVADAFGAAGYTPPVAFVAEPSGGAARFH
jgi:galactokinase